MNETLKRCLDDLEIRIQPQIEERLLQEWRDFTDNRLSSGFFSPRRAANSPPRVEWPRVSINAALQNYDQMALQQYGACSRLLAEGAGHILNVRCNYGSSIVPLLFGVQPFIMDEEFDTLPTSCPLNDIDAIKKLIAAGVPNLRAGFGAQVLEMGAYYREIAAQYPNIDKYVFIYHPDLQGPLDICEVVWGSTMFYALYDQPELVRDLLELATETYIAFMRKWLEIVPFRPGGNAHWGLYHKGNIMIRDDSAMNLSPDMYEAFAYPFDQRLLREFGGGAIHFCGKGDHYIPRMTQMDHLYAINLSQPEYNDMETIFQHTIDKGIKLLDLKREAVEAALARGRDLRGQVHCW